MEKQYKLYAGKTDKVPKNIEYSFVPSHCRYMLIYTDKKIQEKVFRLIPNTTSLLKEESDWLNTCKSKISVKKTAELLYNNLENFTEFLNAFEIALKEEKEKAGEKKLKTS